ncbi:MAG: hypothetical protein OEM28_03410 [Nitrosopumilus sp.]|nr:hypothetical protein [Nitrosopumilus sp.]MDH3487412.1 hypothetical protein [Nitrosopumilus sp.]
MAWVIQCPKHGKVLEDYHFEALKKLELHSKEEREYEEIEKAYLYEIEEQTIWEAKGEKLMSCVELKDN